MTGPKALTAIVLLLYAAFWFWYGGATTPLTPQEIDAFMERLTPDLQPIYRPLAEQDDGREFYMVNLVQRRKKASYPPGYPYDDDVHGADRRYVRGIVPQLAKRAAHAVFVGHPKGLGLVVATEPHGISIDPLNEGPWDVMFVVRHRSRRDFLDLVTDRDMAPVGVHKWASVARTHAFPVTPWIPPVLVKSVVGLVFALVGVVSHAMLRRFRWYRR